MKDLKDQIVDIIHNTDVTYDLRSDGGIHAHLYDSLRNLNYSYEDATKAADNAIKLATKRILDLFEKELEDALERHADDELYNLKYR